MTLNESYATSDHVTDDSDAEKKADDDLPSINERLGEGISLPLKCYIFTNSLRNGVGGSLTFTIA